MKLVAAALFLIFLAVCALAGFRVWGLCLSLEVKPIDLALLLVNVFIAVFLQYYLATKINDARVEKDLLIDDAKTAANVLKTLREFCDRDTLSTHDGTQVLRLLRKLANDLDALETALAASQFVDLLKEFDSVKSAYFRYKSVMTGGDFPTKPFRADRRSDHDQAYRALRGEMQRLMFKINKQR